MKIIKQNVGIDISKQDLASCFIVLYEDGSLKIKGTRKFNNRTDGIKALLEWAAKKADSFLSLSFTMEPTGVYHENLAYYLNDQDQLVHIVLANRAKKYAESLQPKSKTDKLDSKSLAQMGVERKLELWNPGSPVYRKLKILTRERSALIKLRVMLKNQLEAMSHSSLTNKKSINRLKKLIKDFDNQETKIEKDIEAMVDKDPELKSKLLKVTTIPGIGFLTAITIIAETDGFALIKSIKQIVSYAGLDVKLRESGIWKGKAKISKAGNVHIRKALYFPAYSSIAHTVTYKLFYERLIEKKGVSMIASVAVQRKLLGLIYTLWKNDTVYIENYRSQKPKAA